MKKSNFALRLQPSLLDEARRLAKEEGVAVNQLINVAVAEKLSALRTEAFFRERASRADIPKALAILKRLGTENSPQEEDELPEGWVDTTSVGKPKSRRGAEHSAKA